MKDIIDHAPSMSMLSVTCFEEKPKVVRIEDLRKVIEYLKEREITFQTFVVLGGYDQDILLYRDAS